MENTTHIPGPWIAYNSDNGRMLKHWRIRGDTERNNPPFAVIDSGGKILPEYEAASARLIAAAPDLLEACKALADCLQRHISDEAKRAGVDPKILCPCATVELRRARAAIAKATT